MEINIILRGRMGRRSNAFAYKAYLVYSSSFNIYCELNSLLRYNGTNPDEFY